jgi:hypothetical protein
LRKSFKAILPIAFFAFIASCSVDSRNEGVPTFSGGSDKLKRTVFVEALEMPIPPGKNAIWNASFLVAWKGLQDFAGEPGMLDGDDGFSKAMNAVPDPAMSVPADSVYSTSGLVGPDLFNRIRTELKQNLPDFTPDFSDLTPGGFLSYACLSVEVQFPLPYAQDRRPLSFTDSSGDKT